MDALVKPEGDFDEVAGHAYITVKDPKSCLQATFVSVGHLLDSAGTLGEQLHSAMEAGDITQEEAVAGLGILVLLESRLEEIRQVAIFQHNPDSIIDQLLGDADEA